MVVSSAGPRVWETDAVANYPMFELVTGTACGVITHSEFMKKPRRGRICGAGLAKISLPYTIPDRQSSLSCPARTSA